jgi:hypothetical protein
MLFFFSSTIQGIIICALQITLKILRHILELDIKLTEPLVHILSHIVLLYIII